ncbi:glycosyltransferase [Sulfuriferula multivorans]|uniref:Glycosyltransferase n=1 Tax=Sulfuriferula multivorans TaxID=1559896 RepID=A0A401JBS5_9PROT|nr:glycosyltransferase family 4 protein [Sulfuriferula multivorans]GBL45103.1 glycosyltransferase [Sulfuriferula multivorans]
MRIGIAGPLSTPDIEHLLDGDTSHLPREMKGASLLVTLIEALIGNGHEVSAFTTDPALVPRRQNRVIARGHRFTVHYVPRRRHSLRPDRGARGRMLDFFALERHALTDAILQESPDIVHAHWTYEFAAAALDTGLPCLLTCHDSPWAILNMQRDLYRVGRLLMAKSVLRRARHATVVSPYLVEALRGMTRAPLSVVPNPLPDKVFEAGRPRSAPDFQASQPRIAMLLNGWTSIKNPEPGMLAMKRIRAIYPGARMHLYGPGYGPGERAWSWAVEHHMEEAFIFHGWVPHAQTMHELAEMDILLHPALEESFGMTIAEAMALGLPVVAGQDSGAVAWVLGTDDGGGALVDVRSPEKIAAALLTILADPALYARYSTQGRVRASMHFSSSAVTQVYLEHYRRVLADAGVMPAELPNEVAA